MKWKKILSLSVFFAVGAGCALFSDCVSDKDVMTNKKEIKFKPLANIAVCYDTIYVSDKNKLMAAGEFFRLSQTIKIHCFKPVTQDSAVIKWCCVTNSLIPQTVRHEMEHARKCLLVKNTNQYAPYVRSKIAAMNEIMAPCSEIIQTVDDHWSLGVPCPENKDLRYYDGLIINAHKNGFMKMGAVNFANPVIADAVLEYGLNKFLRAVKRGVYLHTIRGYRNDLNYAIQKPNKQCIVLTPGIFVPQCDMWGPLFTYDTNAQKRVDVWYHASPEMRARVVNSVDSLVQKVYGPDYMRYMKKKQKNR